MKSYVVIGLGRFGASLARQLCKLGAEVLALDVKGDLVQQVASEVTHAVVGMPRIRRSSGPWGSGIWTAPSLPLATTWRPRCSSP